MRLMKAVAWVAGALVVLAGCKDEAAGKPAPSASAVPTAAASTAAASAAAASVAAAAASPSAAPEAPTAVAAQHVLVAFKGAKDAARGVTRAKADAKLRAEEVVTKARGGAEFSALVAEYSDDPGSKERQGSVGKFTRDKMVKPFSDAAFALPVGGVSEVVESPFGFHVIKRNQ